jgi:hypothetical protein
MIFGVMNAIKSSYRYKSNSRYKVHGWKASDVHCKQLLFQRLDIGSR